MPSCSIYTIAPFFRTATPSRRNKTVGLLQLHNPFGTQALLRVGQQYVIACNAYAEEAMPSRALFKQNPGQQKSLLAIPKPLPMSSSSLNAALFAHPRISALQPAFLVPKANVLSYALLKLRLGSYPPKAVDSLSQCCGCFLAAGRNYSSECAGGQLTPNSSESVAAMAGSRPPLLGSVDVAHAKARPDYYRVVSSSRNDGAQILGNVEEPPQSA